MYTPYAYKTESVYAWDKCMCGVHMWKLCVSLGLPHTQQKSKHRMGYSERQNAVTADEQPEIPVEKYVVTHWDDLRRPEKQTVRLSDLQSGGGNTQPCHCVRELWSVYKTTLSSPGDVHLGSSALSVLWGGDPPL